MIIFLIGIIVLIFLINSWFYKYRFPKETNDMEMFQQWIDKKLAKRYKQ